MTDTTDAVPTDDTQVTPEHLSVLSRYIKGDNVDKFGYECLELTEQQVMNAAGLSQNSIERIQFQGN